MALRSARQSIEGFRDFDGDLPAVASRSMDSRRQATPETTTFVVEGYWPDVRAEEFSAAARRLVESVEGLRREGIAIRTVAATLVPGDEAAYWVVDGPSAEVVALACSRAGVEVDRIVPAIELRPPPAGARRRRERTGAPPDRDRTRRTG